MVNIEELVVGLYDTSEIGFMQPPDPDVKVADPDYPEEVFKTIKSGRKSPHYVNGRRVTSWSKSLPVSIEMQMRTRDLVIESMSEILDEQEYDHLLGIPEAVTCLSGMLGGARRESVLWLRVNKKNYGIHELIEGHYAAGERLAVNDNVITDSASKMEVVPPTEAVGLEIVSFNVLVDREEGGKEALEAAGHNFASVVGMQTVTEILLIQVVFLLSNVAGQ